MGWDPPVEVSTRADYLHTSVYTSGVIELRETLPFSIILLCGGDKRTQRADIRTAERMAKEV